MKRFIILLSLVFISVTATPAFARAKPVAQIPIPFGGNVFKSGPVFPAVFSMSSFAMGSAVKGKWPIVIIYELEADSTATVTITPDGSKEPFVIQLSSTNGQRREIKEILPERFGKKLQGATIAFQAFKNGPGPRARARFFLFGVAFGDKAVGSITIEQLKFEPASIRPKLKEKALYSFLSKADFNKARVEFRLMTYSPSEGYSSSLVAKEELKSIGRGDLVRKSWDGKSDKGKISFGRHQFQVAAWRSAGDWVFAAEENQVVKVE